MNFKRFGVLLSVATVFGMNVVATKALAQTEPSIQFVKAVAAPGCVIVDQIVGQDGRTLSLLFEDFAAKEKQRKACNIRIETIIPSGFLVQNLQFLYQGSTNVSPGSTGTTLSRSYIFTGGALGLTKLRPKVSRYTSTNELFQEQDDVTAVSASCGGQGQLGINAIAQSSPGSSIVIDTLDSNIGKVEIHFDLAPC